MVMLPELQVIVPFHLSGQATIEHPRIGVFVASIENGDCLVFRAPTLKALAKLFLHLRRSRILFRVFRSIVDKFRLKVCLRNRELITIDRRQRVYLRER